MNNKVKLVEVGPRDGLQNEAKILNTDIKLEFVNKLVEAGFKEIETTSFVNPKAIPQMGDSIKLYSSIKKKEGVYYYALVPNTKGMSDALSVDCSWAAIFTSTSETFNKKNINASIDESFKRFEPVAALSKENNVKLRGYISTVYGCPYEGKTSEARCIQNALKLFDLGCDEVSLGDTTGIASPLQVKSLLKNISKEVSLSKIAMHFHDTRGLALSNILTSLELGIRTFDSSAAGIGGCPYAKGATGNVASEDVYGLMHAMGMDTGIDIEKLYEASNYILSKLGKKSNSKYYQFLEKELGYESSDC